MGPAVRIDRLAYLAVAAAGAALSIGTVISDRPVLAALSALVSLMWLASRRRDWRGVATFAFSGSIGLAAMGMLVGALAPAMLIGVAAALAAWDLGHFFDRTRNVARIDDREAFFAAHLRRLGVVMGLGLPLGLLALGIRVQIDFGWALALGALAVFGLTQALRFLLRESD